LVGGMGIFATRQKRQILRILTLTGVVLEVKLGSQ
jgi:hypothetical protein